MQADLREAIARVIEPELDHFIENSAFAKCRAMASIAYGKADAIIALIEAQTTTPGSGEGWRDIATAPKDGTQFIGFGPIPADGNLEARQTCWQLYGEGSMAKAAYDRGEGPSGAWRWSEPIHNWASSWNPTHWWPLPDPPRDQQVEGSWSRETIKNQVEGEGR